VWALLLLTVLGLTPLAGVLAIGIPYGATLARVLGEHLQNVPREPVEALAMTGATPWQQLAYARIPLASADIFAYLAYRFECAVRAAAVLSFIGLGGIGYRLTLSLHDLRFDRVWTLIAALVAIIAAIDVVSGRIRRTMTV
jgi:phosphonate transport system permease protein